MRLSIISLVLLSLLLSPRIGYAEIVTYYLSGKVDAITDNSTNHFVPTSINNNSTFFGSFSFDNSAAGQVFGSDAYYHGKSLKLSATITIDNTYAYNINSPTDNDEIDILGNDFGLYLRGPTLTLPFAPNPPFSHFEFHGTTQTNILSLATLGPTGSAGVSDQDTPSQPYYFIGANFASVSAVPEPSAFVLSSCLAIGGAWLRFRNTTLRFRFNNHDRTN